MNPKEPGIDIIQESNITCGILPTIVAAIGSLRMRRIIPRTTLPSSKICTSLLPRFCSGGPNKVACVLRLNCTIWIMTQVIVILK